MTVVERILALHAALDAASVPHAFGGALALAWCTQRPRGTVDVNVFVSHDTAGMDASLGSVRDTATGTIAAREFPGVAVLVTDGVVGVQDSLCTLRAR